MRTIILIALAFIGLQASAQKPQDKKTCEKDSMMMNLSAENMATLKTKRMTLELDLTESQKKEIYEINLKKIKQHKAHIKEMKAKKEEKTLEKPTPEEHFKMINTMLDRQIEMKAKMKTILNPEQYTKWEKDFLRKRAKKHKSKNCIM